MSDWTAQAIDAIDQEIRTLQARQRELSQARDTQSLVSEAQFRGARR